MFSQKKTAITIATAVIFALLKVELEVVFLDPAYLSENEAESPGEDSGENEADEDKSYPIEGSDACLCAVCNGIDPTGVNTYLTDKSACAHA